MHDGTTPLILAARLAVEGMVEELINCHADVNAADDFGIESFLLLLLSIFKYHYSLLLEVIKWALLLFLQVNQLCTGLRQ